MLASHTQEESYFGHRELRLVFLVLEVISDGRKIQQLQVRAGVCWSVLLIVLCVGDLVRVLQMVQCKISSARCRLIRQA